MLKKSLFVAAFLLAPLAMSETASADHCYRGYRAPIASYHHHHYRAYRPPYRSYYGVPYRTNYRRGYGYGGYGYRGFGYPYGGGSYIGIGRRGGVSIGIGF